MSAFISPATPADVQPSGGLHARDDYLQAARIKGPVELLNLSREVLEPCRAGFVRISRLRAAMDACVRSMRSVTIAGSVSIEAAAAPPGGSQTGPVREGGKEAAIRRSE